VDVRKFDVILIGNGPSAWAALHAVPKNLSVLNIDIGNTESAKTLKIIDRANKLSQIPINKTRIDNFIKEIVGAESTKLGAKKSMYGDFFMYESEASNGRNDTKITKSIATGGFANVWGATMLPYPEIFLKSIDPELTRKYRLGYDFISKNVPIYKFNFENRMYKFSYPPRILHDSTILQKKLLRNLSRLSMKFLLKLGVSFEPIGLAVNVDGHAEDQESNTDCSRCGLCQLGCPKKLIWNPRFSAVSRDATNFFQHRGEVIAITSVHDIFHIFCVDGSSFTTDAVIIAAGAMGTAEILAKSKLNKNFSKLKIHDNQTVFRHAISFTKVGNTEPRINLAELTYTIFKSGRKAINAQLYSVSPYAKIRILTQFSILKNLPEWLINCLLGRLVTLLVYSSQDQSGDIRMEAFSNKIRISEFPKEFSKKETIVNYIKIAVPLLTRGILLLPFYKQNLGVGGGNHIGATEFLDENQKYSPICDGNGILQGEKRILVADCSAFTTMFPGPITMTGMALAYANTKEFFN